MKKNVHLPIVTTLALLSSICWADEPVTTPTSSSFCSTSGHYCVASNVADSSTVVSKISGQERKVVWLLKEFVPYGFVSDDGTVVASCYPGKNLVPDTADLNFVVVKFFDTHGKLRTIALKDFYTAMSQLPDTVSHKDWGRCVGFHGDDFEIERADGSIWKSKEVL